MTLLRYLRPAAPPRSGHPPDDPFAHPDVARMSTRELADLPLPWGCRQRPGDFPLAENSTADV